LLEVLAPAGELEQLKIAVWHGADAVYLAAQDFGMRAAPANFSFEELEEAVRFAHSRNVKVYQTVNVLPTNAEVGKLEKFIKMSAAVGVDAIIVADVGVLMLARRVAPHLPVHISVQMGVVNFLTANELHALGASRVVLARELTLLDIATIRENIPADLEIECFVHGAICMSMSGRCLISKYFNDRDANHGECSQPCRWEYDITNPGHPELSLNVVEKAVRNQDGTVLSQGSYILNSKDLCMVENIKDLADAGVTSLKIEGRAKSSFYVASCVNAYRRAVDQFYADRNSAVSDELLEDVQKISHRQYSTGFYYAHAEDAQGNALEGGYDAGRTPSSFFDKGYKQEWKPAAVKLEDGWHQRGKFSAGDELEVLVPFKESRRVVVEGIWGLDDPHSRKKGTMLPAPLEQEATQHADQLLKFSFGSQSDDFPPGTFLRMHT
jgi:putative protease